MLEERMQRKKDREEKAKKLLKEKGDSLSVAEKSFISKFAKKDECGPEKSKKEK